MNFVENMKNFGSLWGWDELFIHPILRKTGARNESGFGENAFCNVRGQLGIQSEPVFRVQISAQHEKPDVRAAAQILESGSVCRINSNLLRGRNELQEFHRRRTGV